MKHSAVNPHMAYGFSLSASAAMQEKITAWESNRKAIWARACHAAAQQPVVSYASAPILREAASRARHWRTESDHLVVVGMGGASLGAQALAAYAPEGGRLRFLQSCDPWTLAAHFSQMDLTRTHWMLVSHSGETLETIALGHAVMAQYAAQGLSDILASRMAVLVKEGQSTLARLAHEQGWMCMPHPPLVGRFSVFSPVGLLPFAFAGGCLDTLGNAVQEAWQNLWQADAALWPSASVLAASISEKPLHITLAYADHLMAYGRWYEQLWAESLGKGGGGATPIVVSGAVAQHSQLQLYSDGPRDKIFTVLCTHPTEEEKRCFSIALPAEAPWHGAVMGDVMRRMARATYTMLEAKACPIRWIALPHTAEALAQWMVRMMAETVMVAVLLDVNPYDQPAVEEAKFCARQMLEMGV